MNDFTKEELEFLWEATRHIGKQGVELNSDIPPYLLKAKIQSLIDDYCEHKNIVTGTYPRSNPPIKCDSCGVLYYE